MNLTPFSIKNRNCKVVNFGIRECERQAWLQREYERDNATQAYLQRKYERNNATDAYLQRKGERDNANTPGIAAVAEVCAHTRTYYQRTFGSLDLASSFSVRRLARGIEEH